MIGSDTSTDGIMEEETWFVFFDENDVLYSEPDDEPCHVKSETGSPWDFACLSNSWNQTA